MHMLLLQPMEENAQQLCHEICNRIADVEVIEAYRNVRVSGAPDKTPDPPKTTDADGIKFTTEMMSSGGWAPACLHAPIDYRLN